ncbi:MAG: hypothetical protein ACTSVW_06665, partial [Candidatus Njordarchaeales archaeon]
MWVYLTGDIGKIVELPSVAKCIGVRNEENKKAKNEVKQHNIDEVNLKKVIAKNFVRELYWLFQDNAEEVFSQYTFELFCYWYLSRISLSRIGLKSDLLKNKTYKTKLQSLWYDLKKYFSRILEKVVIEQTKLKEL